MTTCDKRPRRGTAPTTGALVVTLNHQELTVKRARTFKPSQFIFQLRKDLLSPACQRARRLRSVHLLSTRLGTLQHSKEHPPCQNRVSVLCSPRLSSVGHFLHIMYNFTCVFHLFYYFFYIKRKQKNILCNLEQEREMYVLELFIFLPSTASVLSKYFTPLSLLVYSWWGEVKL